MMEVLVIDDRIIPVTKDLFLRAIGVPQNPKVFDVDEPTVAEFQAFLYQIGYHGEYKAKEFKMFVVPGIWKILMHMIM